MIIIINHRTEVLHSSLHSSSQYTSCARVSCVLCEGIHNRNQDQYLDQHQNLAPYTNQLSATIYDFDQTSRAKKTVIN